MRAPCTADSPTAPQPITPTRAPSQTCAVSSTEHDAGRDGAADEARLLGRQAFRDAESQPTRARPCASRTCRAGASGTACRRRRATGGRRAAASGSGARRRARTSGTRRTATASRARRARRRAARRPRRPPRRRRRPRARAAPAADARSPSRARAGPCGRRPSPRAGRAPRPRPGSSTSSSTSSSRPSSGTTTPRSARTAHGNRRYQDREFAYAPLKNGRSREMVCQDRRPGSHWAIFRRDVHALDGQRHPCGKRDNRNSSDASKKARARPGSRRSCHAFARRRDRVAVAAVALVHSGRAEPGPGHAGAAEHRGRVPRRRRREGQGAEANGALEARGASPPEGAQRSVRRPHSEGQGRQARAPRVPRPRYERCGAGGEPRGDPARGRRPDDDHRGRAQRAGARYRCQFRRPRLQHLGNRPPARHERGRRTGSLHPDDQLVDRHLPQGGRRNQSR